MCVYVAKASMRVVLPAFGLAVHYDIRAVVNSGPKITIV